LTTSNCFDIQDDWCICVEAHKGDELLEEVPSFACPADIGYRSNILRAEKRIKREHFLDLFYDDKTGHCGH
jgi:hypothetical protein